MYNRETEIRHISSADIFKLGQILEHTNSWKKLMRIIPKTLTSTTTLTNIDTDTFDYAKKYNNDHIRLIENASIKQNRMSTEILFEEWGTSGKKRPTVGNLLELLIKAELFRAADFVAINFLNESPPERPLKGPAAKIDISLPLLDEDINEVEKILDDTHYPGTRTLLENVQTSSNINNKDFYEKIIIDNKKLLSTNNTATVSNDTITITTTTKTTLTNASSAIAIATETETATLSTFTSNMMNTEESNKQTDLIKFSSGNISENNIPILSELIHSNRNNSTDNSIQILELSTSLSSSSSTSLLPPSSTSFNNQIQIESNGILLDDYNGICNQIKETEIDQIDNINVKNLNNYYNNSEQKLNNYSVDIPNLSVLNGTTISDDNINENNYNDHDKNNQDEIIDDYDNDDDDVDDDDDDGIDYDERSQNESILNDSSISSISHELNAPHLSILDQSNESNNSSNGILNDSSLTTVTETSDDSSFSCGAVGGGSAGTSVGASASVGAGNDCEKENCSKQSDIIDNDSTNIPCISALNN